MTACDIHTHMIPGIDDGSKDEETTLKLLKMSYDDGVRDIILTSHYHEEEGFTANVSEHMEKMQKLAAEVADDLRVYKGNELFYSSNIIDDLQQGRALTLADSNYVLVEFSYEISKEDLNFAVNELELSGYWPIIAHIERYKCMNSFDFCEYIAVSGAYLQVNAQTIISSNYKTSRLIKKLIKKDLVSFVASDCHSVHHRPPNLGKCIQVMNKKFGSEITQKLLLENPKSILNNTKI